MKYLLKKKKRLNINKSVYIILINRVEKNHPLLTYIGGFLSKVDLAVNANKGWRLSKQYRLTRDEINNLIYAKLFIFDYFAPLRKNNRH